MVIRPEFHMEKYRINDPRKGASHFMDQKGKLTRKTISMIFNIIWPQNNLIGYSKVK